MPLRNFDVSACGAASWRAIAGGFRRLGGRPAVAVFVSSFGPKRFTSTPPTRPVTNATRGRKMAKTGPRRLYVTRMLSTPVCGVDSRKETVDPLLAPCLCRDMETGITPQEHSGSGTPNRLAFSTGSMPRPPRCRSTICCETKTDSSPATKNPNSRYGDISATVAQKSTRICQRINHDHHSLEGVQKSIHRSMASALRVPVRMREMPAQRVACLHSVASAIGFDHLSRADHRARLRTHLRPALDRLVRSTLPRSET